MRSEQLQRDATCGDPEDAYRERTWWRYPCGFIFGLTAAGILISCTIPFIDGLLMRNMDYGPNHQLQDTTVLFELTMPDLIGVAWAGLLIGMPLVGVFAQHKSFFRALNSWQAMIVGAACAMTSLGSALFFIGRNLYYWAYLYI